jgi:hypothetical protein
MHDIVTAGNFLEAEKQPRVGMLELCGVPFLLGRYFKSEGTRARLRVQVRTRPDVGNLN